MAANWCADVLNIVEAIKDDRIYIEHIEDGYWPFQGLDYMEPDAVVLALVLVLCEQALPDERLHELDTVIMNLHVMIDEEEFMSLQRIEALLHMGLFQALSRIAARSLPLLDNNDNLMVMIIRLVTDIIVKPVECHIVAEKAVPVLTFAIQQAYKSHVLEWVSSDQSLDPDWATWTPLEDLPFHLEDLKVPAANVRVIKSMLVRTLLESPRVRYHLVRPECPSGLLFPWLLAHALETGEAERIPISRDQWLCIIKHGQKVFKQRAEEDTVGYDSIAALEMYRCCRDLL